MKECARAAIDRLKKAGVDYADIRVHAADEQEHINTLNGTLESFSSADCRGYGVRVLFRGAWGFASSEAPDRIGATAALALDKARAASKCIQEKAELAPRPVYQAVYRSPVGIAPFTVPGTPFFTKGLYARPATAVTPHPTSARSNCTSPHANILTHPRLTKQ